MKTQCTIFIVLFLLLAAPAHAETLSVHTSAGVRFAGASHTRTPAKIAKAPEATTTATTTPLTSTTPTSMATSTNSNSSATTTSAATSTLAAAVGTAPGAPANAGAAAPGNVYDLTHRFTPAVTNALAGAALLCAALGAILLLIRTPARLRV